MSDERWVYMVWGALCAVCQLDGTTETCPSPTVLHDLRVMQWDELSATQAIRYLVTSTEKYDRSAGLLRWAREGRRAEEWAKANAADEARADKCPRCWSPKLASQVFCSDLCSDLATAEAREDAREVKT